MDGRLPYWFKMQRASGENYSRVKKLIERNRLNTICTSGNCPNKGECWNAGTATFMILGEICTRACRFCNTKTGRPLPPDPDEPARLAETIKLLGLRHCVITSVDRDDLPDGGASFWAQVIKRVKIVNPEITIESLIPDFDGRHENLRKIIDTGPDIISHNVETVRRLTPKIRTRASYEKSLEVIRYVSDNNNTAKSGFMLGLGENENEVDDLINDLLESGCRILTIGQYLKPSPDHMDVVQYVPPDRFERYRISALRRGFKYVASNPLVRSSFHSEKHVKA